MSKKELRVSVIVFALLGIIFFRGFLLGDVYPTADSVSTRSIGEKLGEEWFPHWNPFILSGMPAIEAGQYVNPIVYPVNWLFILFSFLPWKLTHFVHWIGGGIGFILFIRQLRSTTTLPVLLFGAVSFVFSLQMIGFEVYGQAGKTMTACYVPWILYAIKRLRTKEDLQSAVLLALLIGLQLLRQHFQVVYYTWLLALPYAFVLFFTGMKSDKHSPLLVFAPFLVGFLLSAVVTWPILSYSGESVRAGGLPMQEAANWSMSPKELVTTVVPYALGFGGVNYKGDMPFTEFPNYLGLSVLIAILCSARFLFVTKDKSIRFFLIATGVALLIALGSYAPFYRVLYEILPGFNKFRAPALAMLFVQFSLSVLATIALDEALKTKNKLAWGLTGCFVMIGAAVSWSVFDLTDANLAAMIVVLLAMIGTLVSRWAWFPVGLIIVEVLVLASKFPEAEPQIKQEPAIVEFFKRDTTDYRVLALSPWSNRNDLAAYGIELVNGYSPVMLKDYKEFVKKTKNWSNFDIEQFVHLNIKYIVAPKKLTQFGKEKVETWLWYNGKKTRAFVYETLKGLSRATDLKLKPVNYERLSFDSFALRGLEAGKEYYVSERYHKNWRCRTETGEEVEIERNGLCMKVIASEGGDLYFEYSSPIVRAGLWVSAVTALGLLGFWRREAIMRKD